MIEYYSCKTSPDRLRKDFQDIGLARSFDPSYNIYPGKSAPVIISNDQGIHCKSMHWGMLPEYEEKQNGSIPILINSRAEGIHSQNAFRFSFRKRRCLIPMDSFYLFNALSMHKLAYRVLHVSDDLIYAAGVWGIYEMDGETIAGFSMLTCNANKELRDITPRMPLVMKDLGEAKLWLEASEIRELANMISIPDSYSFRYYHIANKLQDKIDSPILHEIEKRNLTLFDS